MWVTNTFFWRNEDRGRGEVNTWKKGAEVRNREGAAGSKRGEERRSEGKKEEEESRLERKEEQTIPRIPNTPLAQRERREERRGCSERWRTPTEYQREDKC